MQLWISQPRRTQFTHQPLDHRKPSIRLLEVLPDRSPDGLIQCTMFHASTSAEYTCLSYMWSPPDLPPTEHVILVNGMEMLVRRNLFDFLDSVGTLPTLEKVPASQPDFPMVFWIDALCINQQDTRERNHQVQQMGDIYSNAGCVVTWLGRCDDEIAPFISILFKDIVVKRLSDTISSPSEETIIEHSYKLKSYIFSNRYWSRAWITQEIQLARHSTTVLGPIRVTMSELWTKNLALWTLTLDRSLNHFLDGHNIEGNEDPKNLVSLMYRFHSRESSVPHDQIFSLLSLCDEPTKVDVDYSCSVEDIVYQVLDRHAPSHLCFCCALIVALPFGSSLSSSSMWPHQLPYLEIDLERVSSFKKYYQRCYSSDPRCSFTIEMEAMPSSAKPTRTLFRWTVYYSLYHYEERTILAKFRCDETKEGMPVEILSGPGQVNGTAVIYKDGEGIELLPHSVGGEETWVLRISFSALPSIIEKVQETRGDLDAPGSMYDVDFESSTRSRVGRNKAPS